MGMFAGTEESESLLLESSALGCYRRLEIAQNRLIGALSFGPGAANEWYQSLILEGRDIRPYRDQLLLGPGYGEASYA